MKKKLEKLKGQNKSLLSCKAMRRTVSRIRLYPPKAFLNRVRPIFLLILLLAALCSCSRVDTSWRGDFDKIYDSTVRGIESYRHHWKVIKVENQDTIVWGWVVEINAGEDPNPPKEGVIYVAPVEMVRYTLKDREGFVVTSSVAEDLIIEYGKTSEIRMTGKFAREDLERAYFGEAYIVQVFDPTEPVDGTMVRK